MFRCTTFSGSIEIRSLKDIVSYCNKTNGLETVYMYLLSRYKQVQPFPCGYCVECKAKKSRDWSTRCFCEFLTSDSASFITLTYDNDKLDVYGSKDYEPNRSIGLVKKDLQKFWKRLRKKYNLN